MSIENAPLRYVNIIGSVGVGIFILSLLISIVLESNKLILATLVIYTTLFALIAIITVKTKNSKQELVLLVPAILSAFQNVYLAPFASNMHEATLQILIIVNVLFSAVIVFVLALSVNDLEVESLGALRSTLIFMAIITIYGTSLMYLNGHTIMSGIASARNLLSPGLFFAFGILGASIAGLIRFSKSVTILGILVLVFAFYEWLYPHVWRQLGLHNLWEKKGIPVNADSLLPNNFYASEQLVPGEFIRRMAGPFADPVNFGTFLFALILFAYISRRRLVLLLAIVASILTVSKGALLGLLVFLTVWTFYFRSRFEFILAALALGFAGGYFYLFTLTSSTGSTSAHIGGLLASFVELPQHPMGRGFGGTGVLAGLFADEGTDTNSAVIESGIGSIIGQLGLVGVLLYSLFFTKIYRRLVQLTHPRFRVFGLSMLFSFILNAAFNEVALSPNSSALYFLALGLLYASSELYGDQSQDFNRGLLTKS